MLTKSANAAGGACMPAAAAASHDTHVMKVIPAHNEIQKYVSMHFASNLVVHPNLTVRRSFCQYLDKSLALNDGAKLPTEQHAVQGMLSSLERHVAVYACK